MVPTEGQQAGYRTLEGTSTGSLRERASKFIAIAFPMRSEEEHRIALADFMKEHPSARHFCYGWVLGNDGGQHRVNDAGEPSGTAGNPILRRIQALDLTYCGVIVVRYFGGTKLGKGGLVQAYGEVAAAALESAIIVERKIMEYVLVNCGYDRFDQVKNDALEYGGVMDASAFTDWCRARFGLPVNVAGQLMERWILLGVEVRSEEEHITDQDPIPRPPKPSASS